MDWIIPTETEINRRMYSLQIPSSIGRGIASEISKWTIANGPEWTVKRLKALKVDFIQKLAGKEPTSVWISYSHGVPAGTFGKLFRYGLKNRRDPKTLTRVLTALGSYTAFVSKKETEQQLEKFYGSLNTEPCDPAVVEEVFEILKPVSRKLAVNPEIPLRTVKDYLPRSGKRAPSADGRTLPESQWLETASCVWETSLGSNLWYNYTQLRTVLDPISKVVEEKIKLTPPWLKTGNVIQSQGFAGKIGHIQEPGLKLRAVANPFRVYQLALSRLGDQLYKLVKTLSWDCTHDQDEGTEWSRRKLQEGHCMFAVDLSNATDMFPLDLQIKLLKHLRGINVEDISLFEEISTASWLSPTHGLVTWKRGQPLGLYPSFATFTLTHGVLLRGLEETIGITDSFRVLGDDVVISDPKLHSLYREVLVKLGVPVSVDKTLISYSITEFGGRVITPNSIIMAGKWRRPSDRNFIDLLRNIGPRYLRYLRPRQRKVANLLMTLPEPIGFGLNPSGLSIHDRINLEEKCEHLYEPKLTLPHYGKSDWMNQVMKTPDVNQFLFSGGLSQSLWKQVPLKSAKNNQKGPPGPYHPVELHSRLKEAIGVTTLPSAQFRELTLSYPDVLVLTKRLARVLELVTPTISDPRGLTTLEKWEELLLR